MTSLDQLRYELADLADAERSVGMAQFFKSGPGEYGDGDVFMGIAVPQLRAAVKKHWRAAQFEDIVELLQSPLHEERFVALQLMIELFKRGDETIRRRIYNTYLANTYCVNNWDLVDSSAEHVVGPYLRTRSKKPLDKLARSRDLWERRIAMLSTFHFIRNDEFGDALRIAELLIDDDHDLIHKAVGWMLREIGNRDRAVEEDFLAEHYQSMPRTTLRYAIEKFEPERRKAYLKGEI